MKSRSKLGTTIALLFSTIAFILALYDIFSNNSPIEHSACAWFIALFTLLAVIFSVSMYSAKKGASLVLTLLCSIIAGVLAIIVGTYWILICIVLTLIGCIMYKAAKAR